MRFVSSAVRTPAVFDGSVARSRTNGGSFNYAQFRFKAGEGRDFTATSHFGPSDQPYTDGDTASVLYDPRDPANAELDTFLELWLTPLVLGLLGSGLAGIPAVVFLAGRRELSG